MSDIINQMDNAGTGESEQWVTIKDASDLLGISERHAWHVITTRGFQTKKLLNHHRKKTYVLRADIEQFHRSEQERQKLEALKVHPLSALSEKSEERSEFELSALSEIGKNSISESAERAKQAQIRLHKSIAVWMVTSLWIGILGAVVSGMLWLSLNEAKISLSEKDKAISESKKALSEMSGRLFMVSEREKGEVNRINDKEIYIKALEDNISMLKQDQLRTKE